MNDRRFGLKKRVVTGSFASFVDEGSMKTLLRSAVFSWWDDSINEVRRNVGNKTRMKSLFHIPRALGLKDDLMGGVART